MTKIAMVILLVSAFLLEGCTTLPFKHDLKKIFSSYLDRVDDNPVIIIPGMIGSRLVNKATGKTVWGSLRLEQIFFLSERDDISLPIDKLPLSENRDNIESEGIIDKYKFPVGIIQFKVYRELLDMFEDVGYKLGDIDNPKPEDTLYIFDYDWRRDCVETAILLAEKIDQIKEARGRPNEKFNLLCHSMGALIARYYMRYGGRDVLDQYPNFKPTCKMARNIKRLIIIAAPNLGSLPVFQFLHRGLDLTIIEYLPHILFTMPSLYQIIPFKGVKAFIDEEGEDLDVDLYDVANWKKYGWSIYSDKMVTFTRTRFKQKYKEDWEERFSQFEEMRNRFVEAALDRAHRFQRSLSFRPQMKNTCEIILFGGDTEWTLNKAILKKDKHGKWHTVFWDPRLKDKILKPGDTIITRESLLGFPTAGVTRKGWVNSPIDISFALFVTQRHENIHKNSTFQDNLIHILLGD